MSSVTKEVSVDGAAQIMGVSSATIRNWVKTGHIEPIRNRPLTFLEDTVQQLKNRVGSASFSRLQRRANKREAKSTLLPQEYADHSEDLPHIEMVAKLVKQLHLDHSSVLFMAAACLLEDRNEVAIDKDAPLVSFSSLHHWRRNSVKSVMLNWSENLPPSLSPEAYAPVRHLIYRQTDGDYLGLLHQSLLREGNKSLQGSYYTPSNLVDEALDDIDISVASFLDPCCGSGKYLIAAAKKFNLNPDNVHGFDLDMTATHLARINLLLHYKDREFSPQIHHMNALTELATGQLYCSTNHLLNSIDAIATNPPWGAHKNSRTKATNDSCVKSGESFSLFLEKSLTLLRTGGHLSFLLPEAVLNIRTHADIRGLILADTKISKISHLGRRFVGVFTPVIRLDLKKERAPKAWSLTVKKDGKVTRVEQSRFSENTHHVFDAFTSSEEEKLLQKIFSKKHKTLAGNAEWALGIVTGDNAKHLKNSQESGMEPIFRGSDVEHYALKSPRSFIHFRPDVFQQVAREKYFRAPEKLVYRFISKKLVFAYDNKQSLTLNSANLVIPHISGLSIKVVLGFLNSKVFQFIFQKKFRTHKVLRGDLEQLPFPVISQSSRGKIEALVDTAVGKACHVAELEQEIFNAFGLTQSEADYINRTVDE